MSDIGFIIFGIVLILLLVAGMFIYVLIYTDRISKELNDIKADQFDAEQVMKLYAKKYSPKPQIIAKHLDVVPLYAEYHLPHFADGAVTEEDIKKYLVEEIAKGVEPYLEIVSDKDIVHLETIYKARLRVVER